MNERLSRKPLLMEHEERLQDACNLVDKIVALNDDSTTLLLAITVIQINIVCQTGGDN